MKKLPTYTTLYNRGYVINNRYVGWNSDMGLYLVYTNKTFNTIGVSYNSGRIGTVNICREKDLYRYDYDVEGSVTRIIINKNKYDIMTSITFYCNKLETFSYNFQKSPPIKYIFIKFVNDVMITHHMSYGDITLNFDWYPTGILRNECKLVKNKMIYRRSYNINGVLKH